MLSRFITYKRIVVFLVAVILFTTLVIPVSSYAFESDYLIGTWERFGDGAEGTMVKVYKNGDTYNASLVTVKGTLVELGFAVGDLKWKDIKLISESEYSFQDMFRYADSYANEYRNGKMIIKNDGMLELAVYNSDDSVNVIIGSYQTWRKINTIQEESLVLEGKPSPWAEQEILKAIQYGVATQRVLRNLQDNITRDEFCEMIVKLYNKLGGVAPEPLVTNPFLDTDYTEILEAYKLGIINGTSPNTFSPNSFATREQMSVMFLRCLKALNPYTTTNIEDATVFADENEVSDYAKTSIKYINKLGIIKGIGENKIAPKNFTTREQAIIMVKRLYEWYSK